jgi:NAD+ kinase
LKNSANENNLTLVDKKLKAKFIFGLIIRKGVQDTINLTSELIRWIVKNNYKLLIEEESYLFVSSLTDLANFPKHIEKADTKTIVANSASVISLGGDGTLVGVARYVGENSPCLIGVNFGFLGFLTEILPTQLMSVVDSFVSGELKFAERELIFVTVIREGKEVFASQAVNDVVVQKQADSSLLSLDFFVANEPVIRLRADGLIIATPTGSTAYSLAAGGSIVSPELPLFLITPLNAHSLTSRPLIISSSYELSVAIPAYQGKVVLNVDGQLPFELFSGDLVVIKKSKNKVKFAKSPTQSYFAILRKKLNWGIGIEN